MNKKQLQKIGAVLFFINGISYLLGEFIAAVGTGFPLKEVYTKHFISSLGVYPSLIVEGVPNGFSKWAIVMNIDFIITGIMFFIAYYLVISGEKKNKIFFLLLITPLIFAIGSVLVGVYQGGVPSEDGLHGLGARLSFLGGNFTLIFTALAVFKNNKIYATISLILGIVGLASAGLMNNAIVTKASDVVAIYERMTVYPITIWQLMTGLYFMRKTFNKVRNN